MGRDRKEDIEKILDRIMVSLENGEDVNPDILKNIDFSNLSKEKVEILLRKVDRIIEIIKVKQNNIINSISNKTDLKNYRF